MKALQTPSEKLPPIHPGEVLREEFMLPLGISRAKIADATRISPGKIGSLVRERGRIDAETALRLARYFGTSAQFWLGLQMAYDLDVSTDSLGDRIATEVRQLN